MGQQPFKDANRIYKGHRPFKDAHSILHGSPIIQGCPQNFTRATDYPRMPHNFKWAIEHPLMHTEFYLSHRSSKDANRICNIYNIYNFALYIYNYYIGNFAHKWPFCTNICITVIYDIVIYFSYQGYILHAPKWLLDHFGGPK